MIAGIAAFSSLTLAASPAHAGSNPLTLILDAWAPTDGGCQQLIDVRVVTAAGAAAPTGELTVSNASDATVLATQAVSGAGTYEFTPTCFDAVSGQLTISYAGDAEYAATSILSDSCHTLPETFSPLVWYNLMGDDRTPFPAFYCWNDTSSIARSIDGRHFPRVAKFSSYKPEIGFGIDLAVNLGARVGEPAVSGTLQWLVDGRTVASTTVGGPGWARLTLSNAEFGVGIHTWAAMYSGDQHYAPVVLTERWPVGTGRLAGGVTVKKLRLKVGQRPVVSALLRSVGDGPSPTGSVSFYYGMKRVKTTSLTADQHGVLSAKLPKIRKPGRYEVRMVYAGSALYQRFDTHSQIGGQQYVRVRR